MTGRDRHPRRNAEVITRVPVDDEIELYLATPEPVRRQAIEQPRRWNLVLGLVAFLVILALLAYATPRSAPDPTTPPPGASGVTGSVGTSARDEASASGPEPSGAPRMRSDRPNAAGVDTAALQGQPTRGAPPLAIPAAVVSGVATWYCGPGQRGTRRCTVGYGAENLVAAIDPTTGIRKGDRVRVRYGSHRVTVRIVDVCACGGRRVIDLTSGAFRKLAPLSTGVIDVSLEVLGSSPSATLPPTDTRINEETP